MRFFRLSPLLGVFAALLVPSVASAAELGLNLNGGAASGKAENFNQLSDTGAKYARHFLHYDAIDEAGLRGYDEMVAEEDRRGIKTVFVVTGVPPVRQPDVEPYAEFVGALAKRYGSRLEAIEVWNEADERHFWPNGPQVREYVRLLQAAYTAIKQSSPQTKVVFTPTTGNNYAFVEQAYQAGAKGYFDVMAAHTDTACLTAAPSSFYREHNRIGRFTFLGYRETRATMLANGDDKPIWLTEIGWSAAQHSCESGAFAGQKPAGVSEALQARYLSEAMHCLREDPYVQVAMWFNNRDLSADGTMDNMYGLLRHDGSRRPAYTSFQDYARNGDRLSGPCGDFGAPTVRILSPRAGAVIGTRDALPIRATSTDPDVLRMTFAIKGAGKEIRNFTNAGKPLDLSSGVSLTWQGAKRLRLGSHTIVVSAVDAQGNVGSAEMVVRKVNPATLPLQKTSVPTLRLFGKGKKRTLSGELRSKLSFSIPGKVAIEWQNKRKGAWKKIHGGAKNANKPFQFKQTLKGKGQWRVRVVYKGKRPFKTTASKWITFKV